MSIVKDAGAKAFRDYSTDGVPSSGKQKVSKAEVRRAFALVEKFTQLNVVSATVQTQPASPADGAVYILPAGRTGAQWSAMAVGALAFFETAGGWTEVTPGAGWRAFAVDSQREYSYRAGGWLWIDGVSASQIDDDAELAANSATNVASQRAARNYSDNRRRARAFFEWLTNGTARAAVLAFTQSADLAATLQTAITAAAPKGEEIEFKPGKHPVSTVTAADVTLSGSAHSDTFAPYGNKGTVFVPTSLSDPMIKAGGGLIMERFGVKPHQPETTGDLIVYPPFIANASNTTTVAGLRMRDFWAMGVWVFARLGGLDQYCKAGLNEFSNGRISALDTYFDLTHAPDFHEINNGIYGTGVEADTFGHFGSAGEGGIVNVSSVTRSGSIVTIVTDDPHGCALDNNPSLRGAVETAYNKENIKLTEVTDANTLKFDIGDATPSSPATGTIKLHVFKLRDKARDAKWVRVHGNGNGTTLSSVSVDGVIANTPKIFGVGTLYHIEGNDDGNHAGFAQVINHNGGAADGFQHLVRVRPGGALYTFNAPGVTGFQGRVGDAHWFGFAIDIEDPAAGPLSTALTRMSVPHFEMGHMQGGVMRLVGDYVGRVSISLGCENICHTLAAGDRYACEINAPNAVVEIDCRYAGASHLSAGDRIFCRVTAAKAVRIRGLFGGWKHLVENNSATAEVDVDLIEINGSGTPIIGTHSERVRVSTRSRFSNGQRSFAPLDLRGVYNAVNGFDVFGAATGGRPRLVAAGGDDSIGVDIVSKGVDDFLSSISLKPGGFPGFTARAVNNAVNFFYTLGAATSGAVFFGALGTDDHINVVVSPKGAGKFFISGGLNPLTNNAVSLGDATYRWSDVFLGDGAVIDFGGDVTLTHSTDALTGAGGQLIWTSSLGAAVAPIVSRNTTDNATNLGFKIASKRPTGANNDAVYFDMCLSDSAGAEKTFARWLLYGTNVTAGAEQGRLDLLLPVAGVMTDLYQFTVGAFRPTTNNAIDLGTASLGFKTLYLASTGGVYVGANKVLGERQAAIAAPTGGATIDTECRAQLGLALTAMRNHGLIAT